MTIALSKEFTDMIRASAGNLDGAGVEALTAGVVARLTKAIDAGVVTHVTKNNIRAAVAAELNKNK